MNLIQNGRLDYWTLQKLLALLNANPVIPSTTVIIPEVTAADLAALQTQINKLQQDILNLSSLIISITGKSLIQNQTTGLMHKMLYLPDIADIIVDTNPYTGI